MPQVNRLDAVVALGFVVAGICTPVLGSEGDTGLLAFQMTGALLLSSLALRRSRPLLTMGVITGAGLVGSTVTNLIWPGSAENGGIWIFALMLAAYSLGAHTAGRVAVLGVVLPFIVVVATDTNTRNGWDRISGIVFVTAFVGLLPTTAGRLVRARHERLRVLRGQRQQIVQAQRAQQAAVVLAQRLRTAERLQPTLLQGLQQIAAAAESGPADPGKLEASARSLLARTREEVVALTAPATDSNVSPPPMPWPAANHLRVLRESAQPWTVLAAGAVVAGLSLEASDVLAVTSPRWTVVPASLLVGAPLALAWWRPLTAVLVGWVAAAAYSHVVAPLDGSLSETAFALAAAFLVAALSSRRTAILGLLVCWLGLLGVGTQDTLGDALFLLVCWLGGLVLNETSRLVEQSRANNEVLDGEEEAAARRAVVEERLRLARELHDAVGHSLTVIALQAGAARRLAPTDPERARAAVRTVAAVARDGARVLVVDDGHPRSDIADLVERVRTTGLTVQADLADEARLDPEEHAVAFRIVQEALTNVLRHSPGSAASVTVRRGVHGVEIVVGNSAPTHRGSGSGTGRGLAGIRERVGLCSGQVAWGRREDGGFEVRALLPSGPLAVAAR